MTCEALEPTIDDAEYHEGVIRRGILNLRCTRGKTGLTGVDGRLQAAHLSGPRSDPDAALSGSYLKAPGSAGGYLLSFVKHRGHDRDVLHARQREVD